MTTTIQKKLLLILFSLFCFGIAFLSTAEAKSVVVRANDLTQKTKSNDNNFFGVRLNFTAKTISAEYKAHISNLTAGGVIKDGDSVPVGTRVELKPGLGDISWFFSGFVDDSPFGRWVPGGTAPSQPCSADDYVGDVTIEAVQAWQALIASGQVRVLGEIKFYPLYTALHVIPPTIETLIGGSATLECDAKKEFCTVMSPGTISINFAYKQTIGNFWVSGKDGSKCRTFTYKDKSSAYFAPYTTANFNAATITYTFNAVQVGNKPNAPTCEVSPATGTTETTFSFTATATDPDNDRIRYEFDWESGRSAITTVPYPETVPSGTSVTASKRWSSAGTKDVRVRAADEKGSRSEWTSCPVTVTTPPPLPDLTATQPLITGTKLVPGTSNVFVEGSNISITGNIVNNDVEAITKNFENRFEWSTSFDGPYTSINPAFSLGGIGRNTSTAVGPHNVSGISKQYGETYFFRLCADTNNQVSEEKEGVASNCSLPAMMKIGDAPIFDYSIGPESPSVTIEKGKKGKNTIILMWLAGIPEVVESSVSNVPKDVDISFNSSTTCTPTQTTPCRQEIEIVVDSGASSVSNHQVVIRGRASGGLSKSSHFLLTIPGDPGGGCPTCGGGPSDVCPNIDGIQSSIPPGKIKDAAGNCIDPPPSLNVQILCQPSKTLVKVGETVTWRATWSGEGDRPSSGATYEWDGAAPLEGKTGNPVAVVYSSPGLKKGNVVNVDGKPFSCPDVKVELNPVFREF